MKKIIKSWMIYALSFVSSAGLLAATTLSILHFNSMQGKGGAENPASVLLTETDLNLIQTSPEINSESLTYTSYRVKKGDMIGFIADEFGVTQDTIISVNNIKSSRLIQIGQYLKIPSIPGILYTVRTDKETPETIAEKYKVDAQKCALVNNLNTEDQLAAGVTVFVPDAELDWITRQEINGDLFKKPIHSRFYYSSSFGWRKNPFDSSKRTYHGGIDMACSRGTPIYAALEGTVIKAGWSDVYGNYVIIKHHSGYTTLYGHMSEINTKVGRYVYTNTVIGKVGSTGMSTGPHLHFAVYKNGRGINPLMLLG